MMFLVRIALQRPYTFVVMALLIAALGLGAIATMPTDIFPAINIPVVSVIWTYNGIAPDDTANRIVTICERAMTTTVNDIEHIESRSYTGVAVIRVYFQPTANLDMGMAQVTAITRRVNSMPDSLSPQRRTRCSASHRSKGYRYELYVTVWSGSVVCVSRVLRRPPGIRNALAWSRMEILTGT
jgi:multidrug efflux pump subunit AcrB